MPGRARLGTLRGIGIVDLLIVSLRAPLRREPSGVTAVGQAYTLGPNADQREWQIDKMAECTATWI